MLEEFFTKISSTFHLILFFRYAKIPDEPSNRIGNVSKSDSSSSGSSSESSSDTEDSDEERRNKQLKMLEKEVIIYHSRYISLFFFFRYLSFILSSFFLFAFLPLFTIHSLTLPSFIYHSLFLFFPFLHYCLIFYFFNC